VKKNSRKKKKNEKGELHNLFWNKAQKNWEKGTLKGSNQIESDREGEKDYKKRETSREKI